MYDKKSKYSRYLCIHGHFYQPPRENPWLDLIERQKSAHPYKNWNERITRECYGPNARSRILGNENRIQELINNYEYISFNFGPTLLAWLEKFDPWLYSQIIAADHVSRKLNAGHGNAIAQIYNHIIMPLANRKDKQTQIRWGIEDFRYRFGRMPEGMWLSETAVDTETLELMADEGIKFTILSPTQAKAVRSMKKAMLEAEETGDSNSWNDVSTENIDTTMPYRVFLSKEGQKFIDIFFYDSSLSRGIAYEKLLASGSELLGRIEQKCESAKGLNGLINIATDGESYGHHFKFGEMALTWVIRNVENSGKIKMTNYGSYLDMFPPEMEVKIIENSSWSCSHGVERWRSDCGCNTGGNAGWNQKWRVPLREGLNNLASDLAQWFEDGGGKIFRDPWAARNDYIRVILEPSKENSINFLREHIKTGLEQEVEVHALQLLESQRMALYMFTSCGWFFNDISGLEPAQILMYASRAIDFTRNSTGKKLEAALIKILKKAKSNDPSYGNGARIYHNIIKRSGMTSPRAAAHFAFHSFLGDHDKEVWYFTDIATPVEIKPFEIDGSQGLMGAVEITEKRTWKKCIHSFVINRKSGGDHLCLVGEDPEIDPDSLLQKFRISFAGASKIDTDKIRRKSFIGVKRYFFKDLIPDSRNLLIRESMSNLILNIRETLSSSQIIIKELIDLIRHSNESIPELIESILHFHLVDYIERMLESEDKGDSIEFNELINFFDISSSPVGDPVNQGHPWGKIDLMKEKDLKQTIHQFLYLQMKGFAKSPRLDFLENLIGLITCLGKLDISPDLWECQNMFYDLLKNQDFTRSLSAEISPKFSELGSLLSFNMEGK